MDEDDPKSYRWETEYEKTWEAIKEDASGRIQSSVDEIIYNSTRKRILNKKDVRLGMMRHLVIIIDMSHAMNQIDMKPNRFICCARMIEKFVNEFIDQNPISQLCFIVTRNKRADKISELNGNLKSQLEALKSHASENCYGEASIQNSLQLAYSILRHMPSHTSKEVLFISGSLTSCDPSDIHKTIEILAKSNIRCSVIGLSAEVYVFKALTSKTNGIYNIALDETHLKDLIFSHLNPLPSSVTESTLMKMGFPQFINDGENKPSMCVCHLDEEPNFGVSGYFCPQCNSKYCDLPVQCKVCGLTLVSASHLARSYHHLFPVNAFSELQLKSKELCFGCFKEMPADKKVAECLQCKGRFCLDCDVFIHEISHVCPGC